jgi:hypothetical protein
MLVYAKEPLADPSRRNFGAHRALMDEAARQGIFVGAEPLAPSSTSTTVRVEKGRKTVIDGPFAETKEQLAGYYILDCENLDQAVEWAAKIPTACGSGEAAVRSAPFPACRLPPIARNSTPGSAAAPLQE